MTISSTVGVSMRDGFDAIINDTFAGVSDAFNMVCGADKAWIAELHEVLPDLDPTEARFIALLLIGHKAHAISERALDFLVEQRRAHPELQALMDELADDDAELGPGWIVAPKGDT